MPQLSNTFIAIIGGVAVSGVVYLIHQKLLKKQGLFQQLVPQSENQQTAPANSSKNKVLFLGLDGSGKSSILAALSGQSPENVSPTEGYNVMCIQTTETSLNVWEIGGSKNMRQYWKNFLKDIEVLVYVIDGSDLERFGESISALKTLLNTDGVKKNPVYIVLNKSDLCSAHICQSMYDRILDELPELRSPAGVSYTITQVPQDGPIVGVEDLKKHIQKMVSR